MTKKFLDEPAVQDVTFDIPAGMIFGFIGPSGSGKTTTIRLLTGFYAPTEGEVTVFGTPPVKFSQSTLERIGYMPQLFVLYPQLTVWENLNFAASIYGMGLRRSQRLNQVLEFVELADHKGKPAGRISGGMQRRLSLASTLVHDPDLIFLDEPTAGIDPVLRRKFWDHFKELQNQGRTLFVTTQYVGEAAYCDLVGVMSKGRLLMVGTPEELRRAAFGGEVVDLRTAERLDYRIVQRIADFPFVEKRMVRRLDEAGLRIIVDEASTAMPALINWANENNIEIASIEEYLPPFDDVFVELVQREEGLNAQNI
jgi:ABC-2 type transport system ATP-binding protein